VIAHQFIAIEGEGAIVIGRVAPVVRLDQDQLARILVRQRAEQHRVHYREDCGVAANAQRQRDNCGQGEARAFEQHTPGEAQVVRK
jgi:hypothetical protein